MKPSSLAAALLALIAGAATVHADPRLDGRVITTAFYYPNQSTIGFGGVPVDSFVGAGIEILASPQGFPITSIDFADLSITLDFSASLSGTVAAFNGWRFYDAYNSLPAFTSASLTTFDTSGWSITFDADNIWLNGSGSVYLASSRIQIDIGSSSVTPVIPEPATTWLLAAGLVALIGSVGRRRRMQRGRVASRIGTAAFAVEARAALQPDFLI